MRCIAKFFIIALLIAPLAVHSKGQEAKTANAKRPETVAINSVNSGGTIYFKVRLQGLKKDMQLILEKEVPDKKEPVVVDVQDGIGTEVNIPILYCFKDKDPLSKATLYRLRGLSFDKEGAQSIVLAEKRFDNLLLSLKEN